MQGVRKVAVHLKKWTWCPRASTHAWTRLILFNKSMKCTAMRYRCFWESFSKFSCTKSVYIQVLPSRKTYSTRKTRSSTERTIVYKKKFTITHFTGIALQPLFNNWIQWNNSTLQRQLRYWQPNLRTATYRSQSAKRLSERTVYTRIVLIFRNILASRSDTLLVGPVAAVLNTSHKTSTGQFMAYAVTPRTRTTEGRILCQNITQGI
jgi:hypothetical protein